MLTLHILIGMLMAIVLWNHVPTWQRYREELGGGARDGAAHVRDRCVDAARGVAV
jgi:hypothetical protein